MFHQTLKSLFVNFPRFVPIGEKKVHVSSWLGAKNMHQLEEWTCSRCSKNEHTICIFIKFSKYCHGWWCTKWWKWMLESVMWNIRIFLWTKCKFGYEWAQICFNSLICQKWITSTAKLPFGLSETCAVMIGGEIHVFGGSSNRKLQNCHILLTVEWFWLFKKIIENLKLTFLCV